MLEIVKKLFGENGNYREIVLAVYNNPYEERKQIQKVSGLSEEEFEKCIAVLEEEMIVLSLASGGSSNLESRVMRRIMLINPDIENEIGRLLDSEKERQQHF